MKSNPCLLCGACCAYYRASFYWAEADDATPGGVPVNLTQQLTPMRRAMIGTLGSKPRCIALQGEIGVSVHCSIYPQRASVCRAFDASWIKDVPNERCDKARLTHGLLPLRPEDWRDPDDEFRPAA
ncbi:YkgJ family cysteine cluster protein [Candidatus Sumerlaeota bacterium]|nr:YkgJ family cysteine cluster protein [Candidatus Sumerlaeota bacterium]